MILDLSPLSHILNWARSEDIDWAASVVAYVEWLLDKRLVRFLQRKIIFERKQKPTVYSDDFHWFRSNETLS